MVVKIGCNDRGYPIGRWHHRCKIPDEVVVQLRDLHEHPLRPIGYGRLAKQFGLSYSTVRAICDYRIRGQVPVQWRDKEEEDDVGDP